MIRKFNGVAVAVLALFAAAGAQAQSSVKLYGTIDLAFASIKPAYDPSNKPATPSISSGLMTTSYIGFAGSEDLGGGLKAEFALESFVGADDGSNVSNNGGKFWSRASNIALSSASFGKVALGQYDNPLFTFGYTYDAFGSSMAFAPTMRHYNYIGQTGYGTGFDTGWVNSVTYESPVVAGFQAIGQYAAKESTAAGTHNSYTVAASYNNGPLSAMLTYVNAGYTNANSAYTANQKDWDLGASYDFGVAKAFGQYTDIKDQDATGGTKQTAKNYQLGVTVPLNDKAAVMASFGSQKFTQASGKTTDKIFTVGYDYTLSKRTDVYGAFSTNSQTSKESGQTAVVGIKHNF